MSLNNQIEENYSSFMEGERKMQFVTPDKSRDKASTNITEIFEMGINK